MLVYCRGQWLKALVLKPTTWVQYSGWSLIPFNIFFLTLGMIRVYQVSFSVKTPQKALS